MASSPIISWQIEGEKVEVVTDFLFLGSKITVDGDCSHEIRWLLLGRKAMTNLDSVLKSRDITLPTKVCMVRMEAKKAPHLTWQVGVTGELMAWVPVWAWVQGQEKTSKSQSWVRSRLSCPLVQAFEESDAACTRWGGQSALLCPWSQKSSFLGMGSPDSRVRKALTFSQTWTSGAAQILNLPSSWWS